jgi:3-oxoacyl-[acyl-carrier protein] reductase
MYSQTQTQIVGKKAIVTGGTRGIGRAVVEALTAAGATVVLTGTSAKSTNAALEELAAKGMKVFGFPADVSREDDVIKLFDFADQIFGELARTTEPRGPKDSQVSAGGLDILVNNAGLGIFKPAGELSLIDWKRVIDVNLTGAFHCSRLAIPRMQANGGGYIVQLSSLAAKNPFATGAAYNASKFGLNGMAEAMMLDHRYDNIRVTSIMPGSVDTEFGGQSGSKKIGTDVSNWKISPSDVADMVIAVLRMPERTTVSRVEIRPSQPPKK